MGQPQRHLIDSNIVIDYLAEKMPKSGIQLVSQIIDSMPQVSVVTKIEVLGYSGSFDSDNLLKNFIDDVIVIGLTDEIVDQTIVLRRYHRIKLPDAIIAATAMVYKLTLVTRNIPDFKMINGINLVDPWNL